MRRGEERRKGGEGEVQKSSKVGNRGVSETEKGGDGRRGREGEREKLKRRKEG